MLISLSPQEFVAKWRKASVKESAGSQSHFNDLCRLVGEPTPIEADSSGTWYTFEAGASKLGGGEGYADVWKKGYFAWEYKGKHANLQTAYEQLLKYRESLRNPPLLVVSDMDRIVIHTNFTNTVKREVVLTLDDLLNPTKLDLLRAVFQSPEHFRSEQTPDQVTQQAAAHFAELADRLRAYGEDPHAIAHFLIRLLFCLFAEDINLLPESVFTQLVMRMRRRPQVFGQQLAALFAVMATGGMFGVVDIPHFNGALFDDATVLELDTDGLDILADVCALDWGSIEPSILGTLFERSLDPSRRSQLGAHYTSREDILLIVEPVLMAPLRRRWESTRQQARELATKRDAAKTSSTRSRYHQSLQELLRGFAEELAQVQVLDPACGSGNFLYVALRQLLDLWKEVSTLSAELGGTRLQPLTGFVPDPSQLQGIEVNTYAHELAQATAWIGYIQWFRDNGFGVPKEPILKPLQNFHLMDAILAYDQNGSPVEPEWPQADVIIGNPPFLGSQKMRQELGDEYVDALRDAYADRIPGQSDLVCYWFEFARHLIDAGKVQRVGLLATQGIRGGANRTVLERIKESGDIFWAQSDRDWILEGANVHVSMVGFDDGSEPTRVLDNLPVRSINADLTATVDLTQAAKLKENRALCFQGPVKVGSFDIDHATALKMHTLPNPHGRPNSDVLRPWINGSDITRRSREFYIIDFNTMSLDEASLYEAPFEHVRRVVKPQRDKNKRARRRQFWWHHGETVPGLRAALEPLSRFICTPRVSKHRLFVRVRGETLPDSAVIAIARDDDYFFGVLHSRVHELWALRQGTHLEDRPRYTPTTTFATFPFPWPPGKEPEDDPRVAAIAEAAREFVQKRDAWLNPEGATEKELKKRTLTNLYNSRPTWLALAHRKLDQAVFDAYGWPHDLDDQKILRRLLALNLERAEAEPA